MRSEADDRKDAPSSGSLGTLLPCLILPALAGCHGFFDRYHESKIPQYGCIDPNQPRELQMVSLPATASSPPTSSSWPSSPRSPT